MFPRRIGVTFLVIVIFGVVDRTLLEANAAPRPNISFILCDDLGYGDLACYGHPHIKTTHVDRLAAQSWRMTACYAAAPMCSPSRAGLLTGRTPDRTGIYDWIAHDGTCKIHLQRDEITFARLLQRVGYETALHGKWHLNSRFNDPAQPQPNNHGFGYYFATQFNPPHLNPAGFVRNGRALPPQQGYSCQIVVEDAIHWLRETRDHDKPFFQFISYHEPHHPVMSPPDLVNDYLGKATDNEEEAIYFANVHNLDLATGRYLQALDELKLTDNTLVIFTSDHGPQSRRANSIFRHCYGRSGPFRGRKRYLFEGGLRVPTVMRWPGHTQAGRTIDTPIGFVDFLPTFATLAGYQVPRDRAIDGADVSPLFAGKALARETPLHWHFYSPLDGPQSVMRDGRWILGAWWDVGASQFKDGTRKIPHFQQKIKDAKLKRFALYDIKADVQQDHDVAAKHPQLVDRMKMRLGMLQREVHEEAPMWEDPP